jgi:hypothetical protein
MLVSIHRRTHRLVSHHRRVAVLVGVILVFGVSVLNVHAALCDDDHQVGGNVTVDLCLFAFAIVGGSVALGWRAACRTKRPAFALLAMPVLPDSGGWVAATRMASVRAGPASPAVLRL